MKLLTPKKLKLGMIISALGLTFSYANAGTNTVVSELAFKKASIDPKLPLVDTSRKSRYIKANAYNPYPVCNAGEDVRTVVYKVSDNWSPVGTISTYNQTNDILPVTQTTSKSQTISISVNGSTTLGGNASTAVSLAHTIGGEASYSLTWDAGQQIGPYNIPAGHTGDATYGFRSVRMTGTRQVCVLNGTWSTPAKWKAFVPIKNEVRVKIYKDVSNSVDRNRKPSTHYITPIPKIKTDVNIKVPKAKMKYDLEPYLTVSSLKKKGFAGTAALRIKNVGNENYYGEFPVVSFLVEVKRSEGPKGVDRRIKICSSNGAHVEDLGFNRAKSTHSYLVTLSNPVNAGKDIRVALFKFASGNTRVGRLVNHIKITQVGRLKNDDSYYNDFAVDSRKTTKDDFGNLYGGLF